MQHILTLNAGSSSLKFAVFAAGGSSDDRAPVLTGQIAGLPGAPSFTMRGANRRAVALPAHLTQSLVVPDVTAALPPLVDGLQSAGIDSAAIAAVSYRLVHGGSRFSAPCRVDDAILGLLDEVAPLAPLHMPYGLGVLRAMRQHLPSAVHVACFDTAFHATQPELAVRLPLPEQWRRRGYRRYGFHGLNYEHVVAALPSLNGGALPERLLVFHLGNGASACAIENGRSIATTMGYSPLDGLVMGTRTGALDPGVILALLKEPGMDLAAVERLLWRESGLAGLSGTASDMRALLAQDDEASKLAVESFCYSAAYHASGLAMALGGLDGIVFTGGIGENAVAIRAKICARLSWLGVAVDESRNAANSALLSHDGHRPAVWRIAADEERVLAGHAIRIMAAG